MPLFFLSVLTERLSFLDFSITLDVRVWSFKLTGQDILETQSFSTDGESMMGIDLTQFLTSVFLVRYGYARGPLPPQRSRELSKDRHGGLSVATVAVTTPASVSDTDPAGTGVIVLGSDGWGRRRT